MFDNSFYGGNYQSAVPYTRPQTYMPQQMRRPQISGDQLIKVTGSAGVNALASAMDANSRVAAFDANDDIIRRHHRRRGLSHGTGFSLYALCRSCPGAGKRAGL